MGDNWLWCAIGHWWSCQSIRLGSPGVCCEHFLGRPLLDNLWLGMQGKVFLDAIDDRWQLKKAILGRCQYASGGIADRRQLVARMETALLDALVKILNSGIVDGIGFVHFRVAGIF